MSKADYTATASTAGIIRIHRATCPKIPAALESRPLAKLENKYLAEAVIASCCKPKAAQVYIDEAIDALRRQDARPFTFPFPTMYRRAMGRGAEAFTGVFGQRVTADLKAQSVTIASGLTEDAARITQAWNAARIAVEAWRKTADEYTRFDRSNRAESNLAYQVAEAYVETYLKAWADQLTDAPRPKRPSLPYSAGRAAAAVAVEGQDVI